MGENDLKKLKTKFPDNKWKYLTKNLACPSDYFNWIVDYRKAVNALRKENFFSNLKKKCPSDGEIERTKNFLKNSILKMGKK